MTISIWCSRRLLLLLAAFPLTCYGEVSPAPLDDRFGWSRGDAHAHYVGWTSFQDERGDGSLFDPDPVVLDTTPNLWTTGSSGAVRETGGAGAIVTSSGGIYSFSGPLQFDNTVSGAGLGSGFTRVVVQLQTWGTEYDPESVFLTSGSNPTLLAPDYSEELGRVNLGPPPQGSGTFEQVDTLLLWDLAGSDAEYSVALGAPAAHMTFKEFHADVFSAETPFVTPSTVPEPTSPLVIAASAIALMARRRRSKV